MHTGFTTGSPRVARLRILEALRKSDVDRDPEFVEFLCDYVERGTIEIGDPLMYRGKAPVVPTDLCGVDDMLAINDRYATFMGK